MSAPPGPRRKFPLDLDRVARPTAAARAASAVAARVGGKTLAPAAVGTSPPRAGASGHGLDSADVRKRMVERLGREGIGDARVLAAFAATPRHAFVDPALAHQAYEDTSLPIGHGQTISKPSVVARMLELLGEGTGARQRGGDLGAVLEVGGGCGYQAALLALLGRRVVSVERIKALHDRAREHLAPLPPRDRIRLVWGDGMLGHPPGAPYDSIVSAAGGADVPPAWLEQLAVGGRLVAPVELAAGRQALVVIDRNEAGLSRRVHETVRFVPLKSGLAG